MLVGILLQLLVSAPVTSFLSSVYISDQFLMIHLSTGMQSLLKPQDDYNFLFLVIALSFFNQVRRGREEGIDLLFSVSSSSTVQLWLGFIISFHLDIM
jgi:hypothetical protein